MDFMFVYDCVVFAHILAATLLVGSSLFSPLTRSALRRADTVGAARNWLAFEHRMTMLNPLAALIVLASGLYLGSLADWPSGWFSASIAVFIINSIVAAVIIRRMHDQLVASLAGHADAPVPEEADRRRWSIALELAGGVLLANDVALLYLMIRKPDLTVSVTVLVALNAAIALFALVRRRPAQLQDARATAVA